MRFEHEHVADIRHRGKIADYPGKADLCTTAVIDAETKRVLDGTSDDFTRNSLDPIGLIRQEIVDHIQIETRRVCADEKVTASVLYDHLRFHDGRRLHLYI